MSAACTVTLYLYNDLKAAPLWTKEYTITEANNQTIFVVDDVVMSRLNDVHKGGVFFFGYYQDEIAAQDDTQGVDVYLNHWEQYNMVGYQGFEAAANFTDKTFVRDNYYGNYRTYGLNVELSTFADHTNTIIRNAYAFDKLQGLIMTQKCIELQMNSQRSNGGERMSRENYEMLYNEIEGLKGGEGIPYRQGLKDRILNEVKQLQRTFFDSSKITTGVPPVNTGAEMTNSFTWGNRPI